VTELRPAALRHDAGRLREPRARDDVPARSRTLPPATDEEPDWEHVANFSETHGCELLA
jgi:hypothetical protein